MGPMHPSVYGSQALASWFALDSLPDYPVAISSYFTKATAT